MGAELMAQWRLPDGKQRGLLLTTEGIKLAQRQESGSWASLPADRVRFEDLVCAVGMIDHLTPEARSPIPESLNTPEFREALDSYYAMRRAQRFPRWQRQTEAEHFKDWAAFAVQNVVEALNIARKGLWRSVHPKAGPVAQTLEKKISETFYGRR